MKFLILGDTHGYWHELNVTIAKAIRQHPDITHIVQVGDFGYGNWGGIRKPFKASKSFFSDEEMAIYDAAEKLWIDGNHECISEDTRAVTQRGFVSIDNLSKSDLVLSVNDDGTKCWQPIREIIRRHHVGKLTHIYSRGIDCLVTGNHRVVYRTIKFHKWGELLAHELYDNRKQRLMVVGARNKQAEYTISDDQIRLAAWCLTDSSKRGDIWEFWQRKSNAHKITQLLDRLGIPYTQSERQRDITEICGKRLKQQPEPEVVVRIPVEYSRNISYSHNQLDEWMYHLSQRQVMILLDELVECDGTIPSKAKNSVVLYCSRLLLRDQLHCLLIQNGCRVSTTEYRKGHWRLNITKNRTLTDFDTRQDKSVDVEQVPYTGDVWCLSVPNGRFFVERNGKVCLTGNCFDLLEQDGGAWQPSWKHMPRGSVLEVDGYRVMFFGGASSIDKAWRVEGSSWWRQEDITYAQVRKALDTVEGPIDALFTHEHAARIPYSDDRYKHNHSESKGNRQMLDVLVDHFKPSYSFFGHHHHADNGKVGQMEWYCCPIIETYWYTIWTGTSVQTYWR